MLGRKKAARVGSGARWDGPRATDSILQAVEGLQEWGLEAMSFPGSAWGETIGVGRYQRLGLMEGAPGGHFSQCCILSDVLCTLSLCSKLGQTGCLVTGDSEADQHSAVSGDPSCFQCPGSLSYTPTGKGLSGI